MRASSLHSYRYACFPIKSGSLEVCQFFINMVSKVLRALVEGAPKAFPKNDIKLANESQII